MKPKIVAQLVVVAALAALIALPTVVLMQRALRPSDAMKTKSEDEECEDEECRP